MLQRIISEIGIDQELTEDQTFVELCFNEEMTIAFSILDKRYLQLEFDIGDICGDKEVDEHIFIKLAQTCFGGYFTSPSWLTIDSKIGSYIMQTKLSVIDVSDNFTTDYIDHFLTICEAMKNKYFELSRTVVQ